MAYKLKPGTLGLFYFCKFAELLYLLIITVLMIGSGVSLMQTILSDGSRENSETEILWLVPICSVLAVFNLFYNNLLLNLRFKTNLTSRTLGICIYTVINYIFCHCILLKPCRDKCFTPWTIGKWVGKALVFSFAIFNVRIYNEWKRETDEVNVTDFDTLLWLYVLQHVIFIVARLPIILIF